MLDLIKLAVMEGQPRTTSVQIAKNFGKRHDDVLKRIRTLDCSTEFCLRNFAELSREVETANGGKNTYTEYRITRDGFAFLCMGFTGKKAALWKERYIEAFNAMAARLHAETKPPMVGLKLNLSAEAKRLINQRAHSIGGRTYFQDIRRHILRMVEEHLRQEQPTGDDWLEEYMWTVVNSDSIYRSHLAFEASR